MSKEDVKDGIRDICESVKTYQNGLSDIEKYMRNVSSLSIALSRSLNSHQVEETLAAVSAQFTKIDEQVKALLTSFESITDNKGDIRQSLDALQKLDGVTEECESLREGIALQAERITTILTQQNNILNTVVQDVSSMAAMCAELKLYVAERDKAEEQRTAALNERLDKIVKLLAADGSKEIKPEVVVEADRDETTAPLNKEIQESDIFKDDTLCLYENKKGYYLSEAEPELDSELEKSVEYFGELFFPPVGEDKRAELYLPEWDHLAQWVDYHLEILTADEVEAFAFRLTTKYNYSMGSKRKSLARKAFAYLFQQIRRKWGIIIPETNELVKAMLYNYVVLTYGTKNYLLEIIGFFNTFAIGDFSLSFTGKDHNFLTKYIAWSDVNRNDIEIAIFADYFGYNLDFDRMQKLEDLFYARDFYDVYLFARLAENVKPSDMEKIILLLKKCYRSGNKYFMAYIDKQLETTEEKTSDGSSPAENELLARMPRILSPGQAMDIVN